MSAAVARIVDKTGARQSGSSWSAKCPAHPDRNPSLSIAERDDGKGAVIHCHAGCAPSEVVAALNLAESDLFDPDPEPRQQRREVAAYTYTDEEGAELFEVVRYEPKGFSQRLPDGTKRLGDVRRTLYGLPAVLAAVRAGEKIYVVEGEKDADAVNRAGGVATCSPQGAGKWSKVTDAADVLSGADVVIVADKDAAGVAHARDVARSLNGRAQTVTVVEAATGKDAAEHLGAGRHLDELTVVATTDDALRAGTTTELLDAWLDDRTLDELPPDDENQDDEAAASSFDRIDLASVLSGDLVQPVPDLMYRRGDGTESALFYRGSVNGAHGDSGTGKSWLAILGLAERIRAGENVVLIDYEDTATSIMSRLKLVGLTDAEIVAHLDYRRPDEPFSAAHVSRLCAVVEVDDVSLIVIDSLGEAFGAEGLNEDADTDTGVWFRRVTRPLAEAGAAVLIIDHSTKSKETQLYASGSKRKRAAITGAAYLVEAVTPFVKGGSGRLRLICAKDRHGTYRRGEHVAWLDLDTLPDQSMTLELIAPAESEPIDRNVIVSNRVLQVIDEAGEPISLRALRGLVRDSKMKVGNDALSDAVELLVHRGAVSEDQGPRNSRMFSIKQTGNDE